MIRSFLSFLISEDLQEALLPLKILFFLVTAIFVGFVAFAFVRTRWWDLAYGYDISEFFTQRLSGTTLAGAAWRRVLRQKQAFSTGADYLRALQKGERIFDDLIGRAVPQWECANFHERLNYLGPATIPNVEELRAVHERVHALEKDPSGLTKDEGNKLLDTYTVAFRSLGVQV